MLSEWQWPRRFIAADCICVGKHDAWMAMKGKSLAVCEYIMYSMYVHWQGYVWVCASACWTQIHIHTGQGLLLHLYAVCVFFLVLDRKSVHGVSRGFWAKTGFLSIVEAFIFIRWTVMLLFCLLLRKTYLKSKLFSFNSRRLFPTVRCEHNHQLLLC